jgi:hypothetical protein
MKTIIQIDKTTAKELKKIAIAKYETYNEIILRLLKNAK